MNLPNSPYTLVDLEQLMSGYSIAPKFNDLFLKATGLNAWDVQLPAAWRAPVLPYVAPKDQSAIGSCSGFSTSFVADIHYMLTTGDVPSDKDMQLATPPSTRLNGVDGQGQTFTYQDYYPTSFSPFSAWSPVHQPMPCISSRCGECGTALSDDGQGNLGVLDVYKNTGLVRSSLWNSPMDNCMACSTPYPGTDPANGESYATQAQGHRISSYSTCATLEEVKLAIYMHGAALAGIPVYQFPNSQTGIWLCNGPIQGAGHAIALVGWDESNNLLNLNSWGPNFTRIGVLTPEFQQCGLFRSGYGGAYDAAPIAGATLPGRGGFGNLPLYALAGLGIAVGGFAIYKLLEKSGFSPFRKRGSGFGY